MVVGVEEREAMLRRAEVSVIEEIDAPIAPNDLIDRLTRRGLDDYVVRAAIWFLIDRGRIELRKDQLLAPAGLPAHGAA